MARASAASPVAERCWTLVGRLQGPFWYARRFRPVRGRPASVEFDAAWALEREEGHGDVVGFYHTHPAGPPRPSGRDVRTMRAWASAFGKPLLCVIESPRRIAAFRFDGDDSDGAKLPACELFPRGVIIARNADSEIAGHGTHAAS